MIQLTELTKGGNTGSSQKSSQPIALLQLSDNRRRGLHIFEGLMNHFPRPQSTVLMTLDHVGHEKYLVLLGTPIGQ